MFNIEDINLIYLLLSIIIAIIFVFFFFLIKNKKRKSKIRQSLNLTLFSVKIPFKTDEELQREGKQEKEWISLMEHFYSSLTAIRRKGLFKEEPWICFELIKVKGQISFYVATPRRYEDFIEKQIYSVLPDANVEKTDDFNIFANDEKVVCGYLKLKKSFILPIKTYLKMELDPLANLTSILTQLREEDEGGVQIIIRNSSNSWKERAKSIVKQMAKGKSFSKAMDDTKLLSPIKEEKQEIMTSAPDEEVIEAIKSKISKNVFETNVRIFVSAKDELSAENIFEQMVAVFDQFEAPELNSFNTIIANKSAQRRLIYDFSFRTFNERHKMILSTEELASVYHFSTPFSKTPHIETLDARSSSIPVGVPETGLTLGYNDYRGEKKDIKIEKEDRRRHLYTIGQTGTGKSAFLGTLIEQDIKNGEGVGVIDPHGDLIEEILGKIPKERVKDVVLFDPGDLNRCIGLNMLEYDSAHPEQKTFIVNELMSIFEKLYDLKQTGGPMFEQYAKNALLLLMDDPNETYTLIEIPRVLSDKDFRKKLLLKCKNIIVKDFWEKEAEKAGGEASLQNMVPYITSKFNPFITNDYVRPIIGQKQNTFNFREIMDQKKILLVNLSKGKLGELNSALLGLIIVGKLSIAAFSRVDLPEKERKDFYLYIDEFQNFATDTISTILSEARKYRLCLTVSHQFIGQLPEQIRDSIFGNIGTMIAFRIGAEDAEFMQKQYQPIFTAQDLIKQDNFHYYIKLMVKGKVASPFDGKTYPPNDSNYELAQKIKEYYMLKNAKDRRTVEQEIQERLRNI